MTAQEKHDRLPVGKRLSPMPALILAIACTVIAVVAVEGWSGAEDQIDQLESRPVVTVTATVTAKPKPAPTVTVTATPRPTRVSRSEVARKRPIATRSAGSSTKLATLACIRKHESGGNYRAVSSSGTYHGAYQLSRTYSGSWAERAGYGQWSSLPASRWPAAVQDAVALHMGRNGWGAWSKFTSYQCPGF